MQNVWEKNEAKARAKECAVARSAARASKLKQRVASREQLRGGREKAHAHYAVGNTPGQQYGT